MCFFAGASVLSDGKGSKITSLSIRGNQKGCGGEPGQQHRTCLSSCRRIGGSKPKRAQQCSQIHQAGGSPKQRLWDDTGLLVFG